MQIQAGRTRLTDWHSQIQNQIVPLITTIKQNPAGFSQLPASQSVLALLNFANSLSQISDEHSAAIQYAQSALRIAMALGNTRVQSNSLGLLGNLYEQQQIDKAQAYFEEALSLAKSIQASDIAWQWQHQLGKLYQQQGQYQRAVQVYEEAINNLDLVRGNLLSITPDIQFSFREDVEPVYREFIQLLLASSNPNLELVIQTNEKLQLAELENYLQCGKLDLVSLNNIQNVTNLPTVIHIIDLEQHFEVIVRSPERSLHRHTTNPKSVKRHLDNLLSNIRDERFAYIDEHLILNYSQALYNSLIAPIKAYLPKSGTLVFMLDSSLQSLPLGMLHDGENYLLKQYSISLTLGSQLRQPKALSQEQLKALIAGISQESPSLKDPNAPKNLSPLPEVETEVTNIKDYFSSSVELLNNQFTSERFQTEIGNYDFPIVHITTHGQFSSDPQQTFLLAWDELIDIQQISRLLRTSIQDDQNSIELLVLSACQTAQGDRRSALGIAGVASLAGARSTLATLWRVDAASTAQLMGNFYEGLAKGMSKAEALRQAQLGILNNPDYQHPYYWAPFVLVGSWL